MSQPRGARQTGTSRFYPWRGRNFWSVTSIIKGGVPAPALKAWGIRSVAEGVVRNRAVLDAMLAQCQTPQQCATVKDALDMCDKCAATVRFLKDIPYGSTQRKADLGTAMHTAIEAYTLSRPMPPWPLAIAGRMRNFERFLADWHPIFEMAEASVYSTRYNYAGTLDAIARLPMPSPLEPALLGWGESAQPRILIDYKSSERGVYPEVALQLAAYRYADFIGLADGSEAPIPPVDGAAALQITDETYHFVPVVADEATWRFFLHARSVFQFVEDTGKHVLHEELRPAKQEEEITA